MHPKHLKLLAFILGFDLTGELAGLYLYSEIKTNLPAYNIVLLGEFIGYAYFFRLITKLQWLKKVTAVFIIIFPVFWCIAVFILFGLSSWNSYVYTAGSLFVMLFAIGYYYELITDTEVKRLNNNSEFWIATGLLLFFTGNLPFLGMYNFLIVNYPSLADSLGSVLRVLNIIMYSLFAYAYLCRINTEKSLL
jgi:hypothetical protein